ncbi:MAG: hypothetical protein GX062_01880 [Firmicutes bacterium]|jgi:hypothetical protein|nr:hypothetical protein [Bacillota bacterium]
MLKKLRQMLLREWYRQEKNLRLKLAELEERVHELEMRQASEPAQPPPVVIEQLSIDRVIIDRVELNNNIGALGIRELSGMLNVGANYGGAAPTKGRSARDAPTVSPAGSKDKPQPKYRIHFQEPE